MFRLVILIRSEVEPLCVLIDSHAVVDGRSDVDAAQALQHNVQMMAEELVHAGHFISQEELQLVVLICFKFSKKDTRQKPKTVTNLLC